MNAEDACQLIKTLDSQRQPWDSLWQELADICHPRRGLITTHASSSTNAPDRSKIAQNFDGTAMRANRTLANGQASRITPMGAEWFTLRPPTKKSTAAALKWFGTCTEILAAAFYESNFYSATHEHYLDRGAFGIGATEITKGEEPGTLHFRAIPVGSYSIAENSMNEVDTIARTYRWTPAQIIDGFDQANIPASVHTKFKDPATRHIPLEIKNLVTKRSVRDPRKSDPKNKAYISLHILTEDNHILLESGFDEFPFAVSRWETWGDSPYGWSPAYLALPEATQANFLEQMKNVVIETKAFPRVLYGSNLKGDIDFKAAGLTCYDSSMGDPPREWLTQADLQAAHMGLEEKRAAIEEAFFVPLFNSISRLGNSDVTATQVRAIVGESRELFHPIFAKLTREFLRPILRRSFSILLRSGAFPDPPEELIQKDDLGAFLADPSIKFVSSMALALEQSQLHNFSEVLNTLAPLAQIDPGVLRWINTENIGPMFARHKGLPEAIIRSPEEIQKLIAAEQAAAEQQQAIAATQAAASLPPEALQELEKNL